MIFNKLMALTLYTQLWMAGVRCMAIPKNFKFELECGTVYHCTQSTRRNRKSDESAENPSTTQHCRRPVTHAKPKRHTQTHIRCYSLPWYLFSQTDFGIWGVFHFILPSTMIERRRRFIRSRARTNRRRSAIIMVFIHDAIYHSGHYSYMYVYFETHKKLQGYHSTAFHVHRLFDIKNQDKMCALCT